LSLKISGNQFSGFDYGSASHFSGRVNGSTVSLFDFGDSTYYNFAL
jgi:hypothetical protein